MTFDTKFKLGDLVYYMKEDTGLNPPSYSRGD